MDRVYKILLATLQYGLFGKPLENELYKSLTAEEWKLFFQNSANQGILAIVYDTISLLPFESQPPKITNIQWAISVEAIENRYNKQVETAQIVSRYLKNNNITTPILKGLAISLYYPNCHHRECGDIDLYSGNLYEQVNILMEQSGARVKRDYYVHSHIYVNNTTIENHQYCFGIRGSKNKKQFAKFLDQSIYKGGAFYPDTDIAVPSPDFNALFLTMHGLNHFLSEGIKLRHILDWALLLKAEQNNINWGEFYHWADKMHMTRFANALTAISVKYFGLEITNPQIVAESPYAERILEDTLFHSEGLYNKGYSAWVGRWRLIQNKMSYGWKYHKIYQRSLLWELAKSGFAFIFEKNPKL